MPTETIKSLVEETIKNNKGPFGITAFIISVSVIVLNLPPDYITRLRETWFIVAVPSFLVLVGSFGKAYLDEQKHRTKVEEGISNKLNTLATHFERLFANHLDDRMYFDKQLDSFTDRLNSVDDGLKRIFWILEKRKDYIHKGDTEKFKTT